MNLPLLILLGLISYTLWSAWRRLPAFDRSLATRGGLALMVINLIVIIGVVFLPGKFKLFALLPGLFTVGSALKLLRSARQSVRERVDAQSRFERAKRIN